MAKFDKYFGFLKVDADLAADFLGFLMDKEQEDYVSKLGVGTIPLEVIEDSSDNSFISVLKGEGFKSDGITSEDIDLSIAEQFFADRAIDGIWKKILDKYSSKDIEFLKSHLLGNVEVKENLDFPSRCASMPHGDFIEKLQQVFEVSLLCNYTDDGDFISTFDFLYRIKVALETEIKTIYDNIVDELWKDCLKIYRSLYKDAVEFGLNGILVPGGIQKYSEGSIITEPNMWAMNIYNSIESSNVYLLKPIVKELKEYDKKDIIGDGNYLVGFHVLNAFGIKEDGRQVSNYDDILPDIKSRFYVLAKAIALTYSEKGLTDAFTKIRDKLTNCIVVSSFDRSKDIQLKYKLGESGNKYNSYFIEKSNAIVGRANCKVLEDNRDSNNVAKLFCVFDAVKFAMEPLFSYQAYDKLIKSGKRVTLENTIIGRNLNGSDNKINLAHNDMRVIAIFAGSGSGKGVMTLGLLASIVANKIPFIYLDYKPDMAKMLWEVEQDFRDKNIRRSDGEECRILSIDSKLDKDNCPTMVRKHNFAENIPSYMLELEGVTKDTFAVLPYIKLLQLYYMLGIVRQNKNLQKEFGGSMTYAILDEFQQNTTSNLTNLITTLEGANGSSNPMKVSKYVEKIKFVIGEMGRRTGDFINTDGRTSQCRSIYLGQNGSYDIWKSNDVEQVKSLTKAWFDNTSFRIFGRNGGGGTYCPSNVGAIAEFVNNKDTFGYWTSVAGAKQVNNIKDWDVFKAYSVLNENDYDVNASNLDASDMGQSGNYTAKMIDNISDEQIKEYVKNDVFSYIDNNGNRVVRDEVGFLGLIRYMTGLSDSEIADALSEGYYVIWKVMERYGLSMKYKDIESYLFDASYESILSMDELKAGLVDTEDSQGLSEKLFGSNPELSDDERKQKIEEYRQQQIQEEQNKKYQKEKEELLEKIKEQETIDTKLIANEYQSLYKYKKNESVFESVKEATINKKDTVYRPKYEKIILTTDFEELQQELREVVSNFLDNAFREIELLTFEMINSNDSKEKPKEEELGEEETKEGVIEKYNPLYQKEINKIINDIAVIKRKTTQKNFDGQKQTVLLRFTSEYETNKLSFIDKLRKSLNKYDFVEEVVQEYNSRFDTDYSRLKNEVEQLSFGPITETRGTPDAPKGVNDRNTDSVVSHIDTDGMSFAEGKNSRNVKTLKEIADMVIQDILSQTGGQIYSVGINAQGSFIINDFTYVPEFSEDFVDSFRDKQMVYRRFANGDMTVVVDTAYVLRNIMGQSQQISIEYPRFSKDNIFWNQLGVKNFNYPMLFRRYGELQTINVCGRVFNRDDENNQPIIENRGGLLSRLFNLGNNPKVPNPDRHAPNENSVVNRIFNSAPVRVLATAFGWTMGVKAVMLAATMFGPMGLLFGALAGVGAYKEIKKNNSQGQQGQQRNYNNNQGQQRQGQQRYQGQQGQRQGQRQGQQRPRQNNGGNRGNSGGYNPTTGRTNNGNNSRRNSNDDDDGFDF